MRPFYTALRSLLFGAFLLLASNSIAQEFAWGHAFGSGSTDMLQCSRYHDGFVYICGYFQDSVDFDPTSSSQFVDPIGSTGAFIAKYSQEGDLVWAGAFGGSGASVTAMHLAVDPSGYLYVGGRYAGTADFDPSGATANFTASASTDGFITKLDTAGAYQWAISLGSTDADYVEEVAVDEGGNVYATGHMGGTIDFDPSSGTASVGILGSDGDAFLCKYSSTGAYAWAFSFGGNGHDYAQSLAVKGGLAYVTGHFESTADFDPSSSTFNLSASGDRDIFVSYYDTTGAFADAWKIGSAQYDYAQAVRLDEHGDVYLTGVVRGAADFDPGSGTTTFNYQGTGNASDAFLAKYSSTGAYRWARALNGTDNQQMADCAFDASGNVYCIGSMRGTANLDSASSSVSFTSQSSSYDILIARYDTAGNFGWAFQLGASSTDFGQAVDVDAFGNVYAGLWLQGTVDLDPSSATANVTGGSGIDIGLAKYTQCSAPSVPTIGASATTTCPADSVYLWVTAGDLNGAEYWEWYVGGCGASVLDTGDTVVASSLSALTVYARGMGGCVTSGACSSITINFSDSIAPVPDSATLDTLTAECALTVTDFPTATDNCVSAVTATTTDSLTYDSAGVYIITWTYSEENGNSSTQTQVVVIEDLTPPVPDSTSLDTVFGDCDAIVSGVPTATDNCLGSVTGTTSDPLTYSAQGTYTITWSFTDSAGNTATQPQTVVIDDLTPPVADSLALDTVFGQCDAVVLTSPTATDSCSGAISGSTSDPLSYNSQGTYVITWTYADGNGNSTTQDQIVVVDDTIAPVPSSSGLDTIYGECSAAVATTPTAVDNCAGSMVGVTSDPLTYTAQGTHTVSWQFDDGNGNVAIQLQVLIVEDTTAPVPDLATLPTIEGECDAAIAATPTALDNCTGVITATTSDPLSYNAQGLYTVTWAYDDGNGNVFTQVQIVNVNDTTSPELTCPDDIAICNPTTDQIGLVDSSDNCGVFSLDYGMVGAITGTGSGDASVEEFLPGTTNITYILTDINGNIASCDFDLTYILVEVSASRTADSLTSSSAFNNQWFDCTTGTIISGETGRVFHPATNGTYAVIYTDSVCSDTSACIEVDNVGLEETAISSAIRMYPNPASTQVTVEWDEAHPMHAIRVYNSMGQLVAQQPIANHMSRVELDIDHWVPGFYTLVCESDQGTSSTLLLKQ